MKIALTILAMSAAASIAQADEDIELWQYVEDAKAQYEAAINTNETAELVLYKLEAETPLKVFENAFDCYANTYVWYVWRDYDKGGAFGKIAALKILTNLNK